MTRNSFPDGVAEQIKWYVYRLIDPRNGETFYVGKGQGNRVFEHAKGVARSEPGESADPKLERIKAIQAAGLAVGHLIHRHGLSTPLLALEVEAAVIDAYPGLTNKAKGHGSKDHGVRHVEEIIDEYAAEEFQVKHHLMLIAINVYFYLRKSPYDAVRFAWEVNPNRATLHNLVLARLRGQVVGAYRPTKWLPAIRENFPDLAKSYNDVVDLPDLHGFVGEEAEPEVWNHYVKNECQSASCAAKTQSAIWSLRRINLSCKARHVEGPRSSTPGRLLPRSSLRQRTLSLLVARCADPAGA